MKFGEDVENISKILFLNFNIFRKFKVPNVFCLAVRNFLLRLLPDTVVLCHNCYFAFVPTSNIKGMNITVIMHCINNI